MIKEFKEWAAYHWAVWRIKRLEALGEKNYYLENPTGKWSVWYMITYLTATDYYKWDEYKKYEYSYRTRDAAFGKDMTRSKLDPKFASLPTDDDIRYSLTEAPKDRPLKEDPPKREPGKNPELETVWRKRLKDGTVLYLKDSEYQALRAEHGLEPMSAKEFKNEVGEDKPLWN